MQKAQTMQDLNIQTSLGQWQSLEAQTTIIRSFPSLAIVPQNLLLIYPSSNNHGSKKWFPPIVLTF